MNTILENKLDMLLNQQNLSTKEKTKTRGLINFFLNQVSSLESVCFTYYSLYKILGENYQYILGVLMDIEDPVIDQSLSLGNDEMVFKMNSKYDLTSSHHEDVFEKVTDGNVHSSNLSVPDLEIYNKYYQSIETNHAA